MRSLIPAGQTGTIPATGASGSFFSYYRLYAYYFKAYRCCPPPVSRR
jgi:hypothetical protein